MVDRFQPATASTVRQIKYDQGLGSCRYLRRYKNISCAALGPDELRVIRVRLEFLPQPPYLYVDRPVIHFIVVQPRQVEQLIARQYALRGGQEGCEQIELTVGEWDCLASRRLQAAQAHVELPAGEAVGAHLGK